MRGAELGADGDGSWGGGGGGGATSGRALGAGLDGTGGGIFCALVCVRNTEKPPRSLALPVSLHVSPAAAKRAVIGVPAVGAGFGWPPASVLLPVIPRPRALGAARGLGEPPLVEQRAQRSIGNDLCWESSRCAVVPLRLPF